MKGKKGITLISLMMYLIALSIIIGISSTMIGFFYKNSDNVTLSSGSNQEYTRLLQYLTDDISSGIIEAWQINNLRQEGDDLVLNLKDNVVHEYRHNNNKIYYISWYNGEGGLEKKVQICLADNITECKFVQKNENDNAFNLTLKLNNIDYFNTFIIQ